LKQFLQMGQNTSLHAANGHIEISYDISNAIDISLTAFLLTAVDKVQGDEGIIFYNQPSHVSGVATLLPHETVGQRQVHKLHFDLHKTPKDITKIAVTLTEDHHTGFANVQNLKAEIHVGATTIELAPVSFTKENGIVVLELYLRNNEMKAKSIWRGFNSGLEGLCKNFGVEVEAQQEAATTLVSTPPMKESKKVVGPSLEKVKGNVNLSKGQKSVIIEKTPVITATVSWETGTDYDIYALVYTKSGKQIDVAMFGASGTPPLKSYDNGAVEHMGDIGRTNQTTKTEVIKLRLNPNIVAVVPVVYSAQSNGTGSFHRYKVSMSIDNHNGTSVTIHANNANKNNRIYTCVPGILHNTDEGVIISPLELYSKPNSEFRPKLKIDKNKTVEVLMDQGPKNDYK
jgi:tellurite resistance protein TerA